MNYKFLILLAISSNLLSQTGNITFTNSLSQPVHYEYATMVTQTIPGMLVIKSNGVKVVGRGDVLANAKDFDIRSNLKTAGQHVWGDTIDFTLRRNGNESYPFTITQLGAYTIGVDSNNKLTLKKN